LAAQLAIHCFRKVENLNANVANGAKKISRLFTLREADAIRVEVLPQKHK
jgi:hypothetical protein